MELLKRQLIQCTRKNFWSAIVLDLFNQHLINRRLSGTKCEFIVKTDLTLDLTTKCNTWEEFDILNAASEESCKVSKEFFEHIIESDDLECEKSIFIGKFRLIPRRTGKHESGAVMKLYAILDFNLNRISYIPTTLNHEKSESSAIYFKYTIEFKDNSISILLENAAHLESMTGLWLRDVFLAKLIKWMTSESHNNVQNAINVKTLSLICVEEYCELYATLKEKYGRALVKNWTESTDPQKYIYEDIAIATYLLILWKNERAMNASTVFQSFVDLGCGNGLLVYLLQMEGHPGCGIDLRKRKIWDDYPATIILKEQAITPSDSSIFPATDWIIGNHSDELSPWIPVIAARSSYNCRYFLLPCCAYQFDGTKYQRTNTYKSQYQSFMDYAEEISSTCGFNTQIDRLKIPSTKRIALIGATRAYMAPDHNTYLKKIQDFIDEKSKAIFKPRDAIEKVRNCTKLDKGLTHEIVRLVFDKILTKRLYVTEYPQWNIGGSIHLSEIATLVPKEKLKALKSECGGIQTLLKNHHQIFQVVGGEVKLRPPVHLKTKLLNDAASGKVYEYQRKPCWFFNYHPEKCPLQDSDCSFLHYM